ncbi:MAG: cytochrome C oxidase subunit IV family protein [Bacteroidetes bacterium]|nr:cytochrome C oxidase subunit IV family protein [Bacteroidota bacterium]
MSHHNENKTHVVGYGTYVLVWLALVSFTGITVAITGIDLGSFTIATALLIAAVKSILVLTIFMHLRFEDRVFRIFVFVAFLTLAIFIGLTFIDYSFIR